MATFADASDYGGSIRGPASFCGLFGFKPPHGRNPMLPPGGLDPLATYGTVTRTVRETIRTQRVLAGPDLRDPASLPGDAPPVELDGALHLRLAWSPDLGYFDVAAPVLANAAVALETFGALGCAVEQVELGWTLETLAAFEMHAASGFSAGVAAKVAERLDDVTPLIRLRYEFGRSLSGADAMWTLQVRGRMWERLAAVFERHDVLLCPTGAVSEVSAERSPLETATVRIGDRDVPAQNQATLTYPFNLLNQLPVATVPTGTSPSGVPTGLQIVGRPYADATVLALAAAFEAQRPWREARPDVAGQAGLT
jgi:amidase